MPLQPAPRHEQPPPTRPIRATTPIPWSSAAARALPVHAVAASWLDPTHGPLCHRGPTPLYRSSLIPSMRAAASLRGHGLCPEEEEGLFHDYLVSKLADMSSVYLISILFIYNSFISNPNWILFCPILQNIFLALFNHALHIYSINVITFQVKYLKCPSSR